jgi:acylphosphatase
MERLHAVVHGRVQGVGFRANTRSTALNHRLTGWVRNKPDGTVEVVAEGNRPNLELLHRFLQTGPLAAHVDSVNVKWQRATGEFKHFDIV